MSRVAGQRAKTKNQSEAKLALWPESWLDYNSKGFRLSWDDVLDPADGYDAENENEDEDEDEEANTEEDEQVADSSQRPSE